MKAMRLKGLERTEQIKTVFKRDLVKRDLIEGKNPQNNKYFISFEIIGGKKLLFEAGSKFAAERKIESWGSHVHKTYPIFVSPDGTTGTQGYFMREAQRGHLHGLLLEI